MKTLLKTAILLAGAALWDGCSTPESRIRHNPEAYSRLTPEQQSKVKEGKLTLGLDRAAVRMALGRPDRITERTDASGTMEVWHYLTFDHADVFVVSHNGPFYHRRWMTGYETVLMTAPSYSTRPRAKVIFRGGAVVAYEE
jgi:outer membrane protein assembly factor BamE (lipoprotein component of BamABCDE complex)